MTRRGVDEAAESYGPSLKGWIYWRLVRLWPQLTLLPSTLEPATKMQTGIGHQPANGPIYFVL